MTQQIPEIWPPLNGTLHFATRIQFLLDYMLPSVCDFDVIRMLSNSFPRQFRCFLFVFRCFLNMFSMDFCFVSRAFPRHVQCV